METKNRKKFFYFLLFTFYFLFLPFAFLLFTSLVSAAAGCLTQVAPNYRAQGLISAKTNAGSKFLSEISPCVIDSKAELPNFKIPTFNDLKSLYYDQANPTGGVKKNPSTTLPADLSGDGLYFITTNLTTSSLTYSGVEVVFVDGTLTINGNIDNSSGANGLVFVVSGDINIAPSPSVTKIDAFLVSYGTIYTAGAGCSTNGVPNLQQLVINGGLAALTQGKPIKFCREVVDPSQPAELIIHAPKYLPLLKDLFSQTLLITVEDTSF